MKIPNALNPRSVIGLSLARIVSEDSQLVTASNIPGIKSSKDS